MGARRHSLIALAVAWAPGSARADWPEANPGRPSFSDNAAPTATGAFEVEAGLASEDHGSSASAQWTLKYGVAKAFDVRVNLEHTAWGGDATLVGGLLLKATLRQPEDKRLGLAIEPYVNLPATSGPEGYDGGALLIATYRFGDFGIDANVIVDAQGIAEEPTAVTVTPVVAFEFPITGALSGYVEPAIDLAVHGTSDTRPFVGAGLAYAVKKFLILDAALYVADEPRTLVLAGLTYSMYVPPHRH